MHPTRRDPQSPWSILEAPVPSESGVYPIGVFSDAEVAMSLEEAEETLASFETIARSRRLATKRDRG